MATFRERLKEALRIRGMRPADVVRATGISSARISQYLSGKNVARQDAVHDIAVALNVSEAWLMGMDANIARSPDEQPSSEDLAKVALFGGDGEVTEEMWNEVKAFAEFVKQKYKR